MKTEMKVQVRAFHVRIRDERTGEEMGDVIAIEKPRLQAAEYAGISSNDLIYRIYNRCGFRVLDIVSVGKREIRIDLRRAYAESAGAETGSNDA